MWDQLKQAKELYKLQNELKSEKIEVEERGTKIVVNGKMEIERVELNDELSKEEQETAVKDCFNGAMKKMQMIVAQKMQSLR
jgi:DNA-binding protein YbaB